MVQESGIMHLLTKRRNMNTEEKVILLAKLLQVKELQTHLVKEEQKIKEEISRIENLEAERNEVVK